MTDVILGIETSCDDTAAAVVSDGRLLASVVSSQTGHQRFGGVVPELASRDHQRNIVGVVRAAIDEAQLSLSDVSAVAVTYGPGLAGSLLVGLSFAKALAASLDIPLVGVNHIEGHVYSVYIDGNGPSTPYLCLVVSGGHTLLVLVEDILSHRILGSTRDDAAGEAFDKVAKMLGLPYPGGPEIDRLAQAGNPDFHAFPRSRLDGFDFSFSGLKTSVLYYLNALGADRDDYLRNHLPDICASFQMAVVDSLMDALRRAATETDTRNIAITGGVSANSSLRAAAADFCRRQDRSLYVPKFEYCMDNAAMIAVAGLLKYRAAFASDLTLTAEPGAALL